MPARPKPKAVPETTYTPSTLPADHFLVRLGAPQGSNQFATEINGEPKLVDMPARVRRLTFAARGECSEGGKYKRMGGMRPRSEQTGIRSWVAHGRMRAHS